MYVTISRHMSAEDIKKILERLPAGKLLSAVKHSGVLKLREEPLQYQKKVVVPTGIEPISKV